MLSGLPEGQGSDVGYIVWRRSAAVILVTPESQSRLSATLASGSEGGRSTGNTDLAGILTQAHRVDVARAVLHLPLAAPELFRLRASACTGGRQDSASVYPLGILIGALPADLLDLLVEATDRGQRGQHAIASAAPCS